MWEDYRIKKIVFRSGDGRPDKMYAGSVYRNFFDAYSEIPGLVT